MQWAQMNSFLVNHEDMIGIGSKDYFNVSKYAFDLEFVPDSVSGSPSFSTMDYWCQKAHGGSLRGICQYSSTICRISHGICMVIQSIVFASNHCTWSGI